MIVSFINQKGGCGKTTFAVNFAVMSAIDGHSTILVDMDPQRSSVNFRALRPDDRPQFNAVSVLTPTIHKDIKGGGFNFEHVFIDSGGRDSVLFRSAMAASDKVVIPVIPGQFDIWALEDTFKVLEEARQYNEKCQAYIALNHVIHNTVISKDAISYIANFAAEKGLILCKSLIYSRVGYIESSQNGLGVTEMTGRKYEQAKSDITKLYKEITK